jgi:hypothetical protein
VGRIVNNLLTKAAIAAAIPSTSCQKHLMWSRSWEPMHEKRKLKNIENNLEHCPTIHQEPLLLVEVEAEW